MKGSWKWWLVLFAGTLPIGYGLQYFLAGEADHDTGRMWLAIGQIIVGLGIVGYALMKVITSGHAEPDDDVEKFKITED